MGFASQSQEVLRDGSKKNPVGGVHKNQAARDLWEGAGPEAGMQCYATIPKADPVRGEHSATRQLPDPRLHLDSVTRRCGGVPCQRRAQCYATVRRRTLSETSTMPRDGAEGYLVRGRA
jgi:hypothetical protein